MPNAADYIEINITNNAELQKLFTELQPSVQNKIVLAGMRESAKIILQEAKSRFKTKAKGKSKTGYKYINKSFTTEPMKSTFGLRVGIKNYKMRWIEWGTADRYYKNKHYTGKLEPTNFFYGAVKAKQEEASKYVSEAIIKSLEKTIKKYNK